VKWLGTASLEIVHDGKALLIDPHLSRLSKWRSFTRPIEPDRAKIDAYLATLDAEPAGIVVTHAHSDHAQDVPYIAGKLGAPVWGNESVDTLLKMHGLPGCPQILAGGERFAIGPFTLEAVKTRHGLVALGHVPFPGKIAAGQEPPLRVWKYRHGEPPLLLFVEVAGRSLFHLGTANLIDNLLPAREVDDAWICVSGYQSTPQFLERLFRRVRPRRVIPFHFEDFSLPLSADTRYIPGSDPFAFADRVRRLAPGAATMVPRPYEAVAL
jgi:L-ascorbate metabolism protein UlaG (beta-lactamase superfamily)